MEQRKVRFKTTSCCAQGVSWASINPFVQCTYSLEIGKPTRSEQRGSLNSTEGMWLATPMNPCFHYKSMQIPTYWHLLRGKMWNAPCLFHSMLTWAIREIWGLLSYQSTPFDPKMRTVYLTPLRGPAEGLSTIASFASHRFLPILDMW
jgi:hypothetical protein